MQLPEPAPGHILLVRTDYFDDAAWDALGELLLRPVDGFAAGLLHFVSDRSYDGVSPDALAELASGSRIRLVFRRGPKDDDRPRAHRCGRGPVP